MRFSVPITGWPEDYNPSDFQYDDREDQFLEREEEEEEEPSDDEIIRQRKLFFVADENPVRLNHQRRGRPKDNIRNMDVESLKNPDPKRSNNRIGQTTTTEREKRNAPAHGDSRPQKRKRTHLPVNVTQGVERNGSSVLRNKERQNQDVQRRDEKVQQRQRNAAPGANLREMHSPQGKGDSYRRQGVNIQEPGRELEWNKTQEPPLGAKIQHKPKRAERARQGPGKMQRPNWDKENRPKPKIHEDVTPESQIYQRKNKTLRQDDRRGQHNDENSMLKGNARMEPGHATSRPHLGKDVKPEPQDVERTRPGLERIQRKNQGPEDHDEGIHRGQKMGLEENVEKSQDLQPVELGRWRNGQRVENPPNIGDDPDGKQRVEYVEKTTHVTPAQDVNGIGGRNQDVGQGGAQKMEDETREKQIQPNKEENPEGNAGDDQEEEAHQPYREDDPEEEDEEDEELEYPFVFEKPVFWNRTFNVSQTDFHVLRSDYIDLQCNTSGNLQLKESEAMTVVRAFMKKLNQWHRG